MEFFKLWVKLAKFPKISRTSRYRVVPGESQDLEPFPKVYADYEIP